MAQQNLELALRIRTDLKNAAKQLDDFEKELDGVSVAAAEADTSLDKVTAPRKAESSGQLEQLEKDLENVSEAARNADAALEKTTAVKDNGTAKQLDKIEKELIDVTTAATKASTGIKQVTASNQTSATSKNTAAVKANNDAMRDGAISAGQYKQAMRQLPAQITDITTSLASGMPIWLVAIQQGGQIKDSFGGTREAAKALASTIKPIPLLLGGLAAATAVVVLAHERGAAESRRYTEALILSGNAAGTNSGQLAEMSKRLDQVAGTRRQAAAALADIAQSGKLSAEQIEQVGLAAVKMQLATGRAVDKTVDHFLRLADDPVQAIAKLNEQYHFLDAAIYSNIAALQDQGREVEAVQLALETYATEMNRRSDELVDNIGWLEKGWRGLKTAAGESWDAMLGIGRADTLEDQLERVNQRIREQQEIRQGRRRGNVTNLGDLSAEKARLELQIQQRDEQSAREGERRRIDAEAIAAMREVDRLTQSNLSKEEKRLAALKEYRNQLEAIRQANPDDPRLQSDTIANNIAGINARYTDKKSIDRESKSLESFVAQLERQAEVLGKSAAETRAYNIAEKRLSGELLARAQAANAVITAQEKLNQATADAKQLATIENRLLSLQGRTAEARSNDLENQYADLLLRLQARSDTAGIELVNSLINVEKAQAQLDELQAQVARVLSEQNRQEQTIQAQQEAGLITELSAREQLLQLHRDTTAQVETLIPQMEVLAEATGDPDAIERVRQLKAEIEQLRVTTERYGSVAQDAFEESITDGLVALASGAESLSDVIQEVIASIAQAIARLAAEKAAAQITQMAVSAVSGYADGGYTGAGTKYQVAGVVHAGEYVQPAEVMREPGAMAFMENFRREGMRSLERFRGYAEGGPVGLSAANYDSPAQTLAASMPEMTVRQRLLPVLDKDLISDALRGPEGEQLIELHIKRNPGKFRQMLGG
ncbi:phage tail length tape measure family protein [Microbulbifer sp. ANSA003]|uniref:phage tail length tape measure family protein n=1 Tax=Microbulbifer sp. ANSA003 TaxID=3243360 RepID=UPI004042D54C